MVVGAGHQQPSEVTMKQNEISAERPTRRRWLRRVGGAVIVAVAAMAAPVVTAAPAAAVSQTVIHPEWVDGCEGCPGPLFHVQQVLDRRAVVAVTNSVADGLSGLIAAARATDPVVARRLHEAAIRTLSTGAAQAGNSAWSGAEWDGDLCPRKPWPFPGPKPHWNETMTQLADGLTVLGEANRTGDAALIGVAAGKLDAGAADLTDFQGCV
jgi:hypothetical protein